jgi:hypothetical protein
MIFLQRLELDHFITSVAKEPTIHVGRTDFRRTNYLLILMIKMTVATNSSNQHIQRDWIDSILKMKSFAYVLYQPDGYVILRVVYTVKSPFRFVTLFKFYLCFGFRFVVLKCLQNERTNSFNPVTQWHQSNNPSLVIKVKHLSVFKVTWVLSRSKV